MQLFVSHLLGEDSPVYPGNSGCRIVRDYIVGEKGAVFNASTYSTGNHVGTHMDAPAHFVPNGLTINQLPMEYFNHQQVPLLEIPKSCGEGITVADLEPHHEAFASTTAVLIRTGFESKRVDEKILYETQCPFFYPEACKYLVENFPNLLLIGFDFLSLGSEVNTLGVPAHRQLLGYAPEQEKFICCIEDMHLAELPVGVTLTRFTNLPMRIATLDSCQVTCVAEF